VTGYQGKVAVVTGAASGIGYVVNTSSIDGLVTVRNAAGYVAAKHARAEDIAAGRNPGDESVDPNFARSTGRTPS
jgi:NADP-dependent 3-hydroxy acid dehydrogenase YdfG